MLPYSLCTLTALRLLTHVCVVYRFQEQQQRLAHQHATRVREAAPTAGELVSAAPTHILIGADGCSSKHIMAR